MAERAILALVLAVNPHYRTIPSSNWRMGSTSSRLMRPSRRAQLSRPHMPWRSATPRLRRWRLGLPITSGRGKRLRRCWT